MLKMHHSIWIEYSFLNVSAAVAIALDAMAMIIVSAKDFGSFKRVLFFVALVAFTHITFPLLGFVGGFIILTKYPFTASAVYLSGALLLVLLIRSVIKKTLDGAAADHSIKSDKPKEPLSLSDIALKALVVSVDALMTGPSKNFLADRYDTNLVYLSFVIVGGLVGILVFFSGFTAYELYKNADHVESISISGQVTLFSLFICLCFGDALSNLPEQYRINVRFEVMLLLGLFLGVAVTFFVMRARKVRRVNAITRFHNRVSDSSESE